MESIIIQYLDSRFPDDFTFDKRDSRMISISYGGSPVMWINPRNGFIRYDFEFLKDINSWFGVKDYNFIRQLITKWLLGKCKVENINQFVDYAINHSK